MIRFQAASEDDVENDWTWKLVGEKACIEGYIIPVDIERKYIGLVDSELFALAIEKIIFSK